MRKSLLTGVVSLLVLGVSWLYYGTVENNVIKTATHLRQSRVQLQRAEQRLHRLEAGEEHNLQDVLGEDITSVQLRLAEFLGRQDTSPDASIESYAQSILPEPLAGAGQANATGLIPELIRTLRLEVVALVAHAPAMLDLIGRLSQEVSGWPMDVRACDVHRMPTQKLRAHCVIDVYYWMIDREA